ncbi:hypothetical protein F5Y18DRAFT_427615 [Xylariaceae sp. FL1019]|nr:hypothetical protein F5Y18DRAFT_427615 [Xylariaceae sp. FL1019]
MGVVPLIVLLPEEGFRWKSEGRGDLFLDNDQRKIITKALKQDCPAKVDHAFTAAKFAELFEVAVNNLESCASMTPAVFWGHVRQEVRWARNSRELDGELLYALSLQIIGARYFALHDMWEMEGDYEARRWMVGKEEMDTLKLRSTQTDFTRIVDSYTDKIHEMYAKKAHAVREAYVPYWSQSANNEGSAAASFGDNYVAAPCLIEVSDDEEDQKEEEGAAEEDKMDIDG